MQMTESNRTNSLPRTLLVACLVLFLMRVIAIYYAVYCPPPATRNTLTWQEPKPIDVNRQDLLSTPILYYFCDMSDQFTVIFTDLFEDSLFNNRELVDFIKAHFKTVKVEHRSKVEGQLSDEIIDKYSVTTYPHVVIALPNGKEVSGSGWSSDRLFLAFLKDGAQNCNLTAAREAMMKGIYAVASEAYAREDSDKALLYGQDGPLAHAIYWSFALRHEKKDDQARSVLKNALARCDSVKPALPLQFRRQLWRWLGSKGRPWPIPCVRYLLGEISVDDLIKQAEKDHWQTSEVTNVHYVCGVNARFDGDLEAAKKHLRMACSKKSERSDDYNFARRELEEMGEQVAHSDKD